MSADGLLALQSQLAAVMKLSQHLESIARGGNLQADVQHSVSPSQSVSETGVQGVTEGLQPSVLQSTADVSPTPVRWYAVVVGRTPGVYDDGKAVTKNIEGVNSNVVHKAHSREDAVALYNEALRKGEVVRVTITREVLIADDTNML